MKYIVLTPLLFVSLSVFAQNNHYLLAGTYTRGKSAGMYVYNFNTSDGSASVVDSVKTSNPSFLAVSPNQHFVYAANEDGNNNNGGNITAFNFDNKTGHLSELNHQPSSGDNPCYVTVDKTGKWVIVGNYSSGTLAVLPINKDGSLGVATTTIHHTGHGVNKDRQEGPHVHSTVLSADNRYLFVPDLGMDKVMIYAFDARTGKLSPMAEPFVKLKDGSGPRHFDFHPSGKWAYLAQEMAGTVTAFNYANGKLKVIQTISSLPKEYTGSATTADIHVSPDGKFLYVSNRDQSNTIAIFKIDRQTGMLAIAGYQSTIGKTPRNFNFDPTGNYLLVANQNTDNVIIFKVNHSTGLLTDTGKRIDVGNPVCIKWVKKKPLSR